MDVGCPPLPPPAAEPHPTTQPSSPVSPSFFCVKEGSHMPLSWLGGVILALPFLSSLSSASCTYYRHTLWGSQCRPPFVRVCLTGCSQCFVWRPSWFFFSIFVFFFFSFFLQSPEKVFALLSVLLRKIFCFAHTPWGYSGMGDKFLYRGNKQNDNKWSFVGFFFYFLCVMARGMRALPLFVLHLCLFVPFFSLFASVLTFISPCFLPLCPPLPSQSVTCLSTFIPQPDSSAAPSEKEQMREGCGWAGRWIRSIRKTGVSTVCISLITFGCSLT